ncbi:hypothetical protein ABKV19_017097 [Rosa sericea]
MDIASSSSSSSSSSSFSLPKDVFLSFRGQDIRSNFVCHLSEALERRAVKVYLDNEDLKRGDDLSDLLNAIAEAKISIVIFSENYATSTWCLKELVKILECKAKQKQIVMPIFYRVDPSDIRKQTGSFAKAFAEYERDRKKDKKEVQSWRSALKEAANLAGCNSKNYEDDAKLIGDIVKEVLPHLHQATSTAWIFFLSNVGLEIASAMFDQFSSPSNKRHSALISMVLAILALFISIGELIHKGIKEGVEYRRQLGVFGWFYSRARNRIFGSFPDMCGLLGGISQCVYSTIQYVCIRRQVENPYRIFLWPMIFLLCLGASRLHWNQRNTTEKLKQ